MHLGRELFLGRPLEVLVGKEFLLLLVSREHVLEPVL